MTRTFLRLTWWQWVVVILLVGQSAARTPDVNVAMVAGMSVGAYLIVLLFAFVSRVLLGAGE